MQGFKQLAGPASNQKTFVRHTSLGECELLVQLKAICMGDERALSFSPRYAAGILQL